jgi:hypothetical protein
MQEVGGSIPPGSTISACAPPPTNPAREFRFEAAPLTSTVFPTLRPMDAVQSFYLDFVGAG